MKNSKDLNKNIIDASNATEDDSHLKSKLSANALFNFMTDYGYLEKIINNMYFSPRYNTEYVDYLELDYQGEKLMKWMIPMTCFCDIPLHQVSYHAEGTNGSDGYGKFCIAIHKEFGIRNNIQPVQYLNPESVLTYNLKEALNILLANRGQANSDLDNDTYVTLTNYLFEHIVMIKPHSGFMDKKSKVIKKNFHDEHEWRYIPQLNHNELPPMLIDEEEILVEQKRRMFTKSIAHSKGLLKFKVEDIRYIFVDTIESRDRLIDFIRHKKDRKWTLEEKYLLVSKIKVYDELKEDW